MLPNNLINNFGSYNKLMFFRWIRKLILANKNTEIPRILLSRGNHYLPLDILLPTLIFMYLCIHVYFKIIKFNTYCLVTCLSHSKRCPFQNKDYISLPHLSDCRANTVEMNYHFFNQSTVWIVLIIADLITTI